MITVSGQLAIKTISGRNGKFNVGRLTISLGEFVVKDAELDQFPEGKYDGDFSIIQIRPSTYFSGGRTVTELRAVLDGMTLSKIDALSNADAGRVAAQEPDPIDEEAPQPKPAAPTPAPEPVPEIPVAAAASSVPDSTPFQSKRRASAAPVPTPAPADATSPPPPCVNEDEVLFGTLWPLGSIVKLDKTVDRRVFREQCRRMDVLGYDFDMLSQEWRLTPAAA